MKIISLLSTVMLSGCSFLYHQNTENNRPLSYQSPPADCAGTIPIAVHWGAGWHTSMVIPNRDSDVSRYFSHFPYLEVNWGDKGFYQAGASQWAQQIATPKAMLLPSSSVMYFVGVPAIARKWCAHYNQPLLLSATDQQLQSAQPPQAIRICDKIQVDYQTLFRHFDGHQIWVSEQDFNALTQKINDTLKKDHANQPIDLGNGYLFDSAYSTAGRFFASDAYYFGLLHTCNSWTAEVLGEIKTISALQNHSVYRAEAIFSFLQAQIKEGNACVRSF